MKLRSLAIEGVRCLSGTFAFSGRDLLTGPNGSGKSTLLDSIGLLLFGFDPRRGKGRTNAMAAWGASSMTVAGEFVADDGSLFVVERRIDTSGAMPKSEVTVSPARGERTAAELEARIRAEIGIIPGVFNLDEFVGLTPGKCSEFLAPLLAGSGDRIDAEAFLAELTAAEAPVTGAVAAAIRKAWKPLNATQDNCALAVEVLDGALSAAVANERGSGDELARLRESRRSMDATPGTAADVTKERDGVRGELSKLEGELLADSQVAARFQAAQKAADEARAAKAAAEQARADAETAHRTVLEGSDPEALAIEAGLLESEADAIEDPEPIAPPAVIALDEPQMARARDLQAQADEARATARTIVIPEALTTTDAEQGVTRAERALALAKESAWREVERLAADIYDATAIDVDRANGAAGESSPVSGQVEDLRALSAKHGGDLAAFEADLDAARSALETRIAECRSRDASRADLEGARRTIDARESSLRREAETIVSDAHKVRDVATNAARAAYDAAAKARATTAADLEARRKDLRKRASAIRTRIATIARLAGALSGAEAALRIAQDADERARQALAEAPGTIDTEDAKRRAEHLRITIKSLDERIAAKEQARAIDERIAKTEAIAEGGKTAAQALRKAKGAAKDVVAKLVGKSLEPLAAAVGGLLARVSPDFRLEVRTDSGVEFYGQTEAGRPAVPFGELSGGQRVVFGAALALALVKLHKPRCRILPLEAAEADAHNLLALLAALDAMGSDFGTILVATCHGPERAPEGWATIDMGALAGVK